MLPPDHRAGPRSVRTPHGRRPGRRSASGGYALLPARSSGFRHSRARLLEVTRPLHASGRRSTPATRAGRATPARRPRATAAAAASGEPYRSHNARNRTVVSTDGRPDRCRRRAVANQHSQLLEPVIGHARRPLHPRRAKSGSPTEGQPLRSALLRATQPPPAPRAARSIAVHGRAGEQNSRRASRAQGRPDTPPPAERSPPEVALPSVGSPSGPLPPLRRQQPHTGLGRPGAASFSTVAVRYGCRATSLTYTSAFSTLARTTTAPGRP